VGGSKSIGTVDGDGVALAAIQGLNAKLEREIAALRAERASPASAAGLIPGLPDNAAWALVGCAGLLGLVLGRRRGRAGTS
jgi:hypothetical protein